MDVVHLFGSTQSDFYFKLSKMYASAVLRPDGVAHRFASIDVDGRWRFGQAPEVMGPEMPLSDALRHLGQPDLVVPHMFCRQGMTAYRALIENVLELPLVGAPADVAGLATSKLWTRAVVASAGVTVADAERLSPGQTPGLPLPYVVKPDSEDNSLGISIVRQQADAADAVAQAFEFAPVVFAETFIPGREFRAAVVETSDGPVVPAFIEYPVSEARPIRDVGDKLEAGAKDGDLTQSTRADAQPICPAQMSSDLAAKLTEAALTAHRALGARDYSLFDFRVHRDTGAPVLLEAGLFWSFSDLSAITKMLHGSGLDPVEITHDLWRQAAKRGAFTGKARSLAAE